MIVRRRELLICGAAFSLFGGSVRADDDPPPPPLPRTPFTLDAGRIRVAARIAGVEVSALLDSGGQQHVLDQRLARDLRIKASGKVTVASISGQAKGRYSDPLDVEVAGKTLAGSQFLVMDLSPMSQGGGQPVEMILASPLFRRYAVDVDFEAGSLLVVEPADLPVPDAGIMAPVVPAGAYLTTEVELPGGTVKAVIDTGSAAPLILSPAAAERLGVLQAGPVSTAPVTGLAGSRPGQITSVATLFVGGHDFFDVPVVVAPGALDTEANLGCGILSRFHVGIDFPERWLLVSSPRDGPFKRDLTGLYGAIEGGSVRITHVARASPAERAGFRVGERIIAIDGETAATANGRLADAPAGRTVACTLRGGRTRSLTLARYY